MFRKGYSTIDRIFTIGQLIERGRGYMLEIHSLFLDCSKAFDSIDRKMLLEAMKEQGVPREIERLLENMYKNAEA